MGVFAYIKNGVKYKTNQFPGAYPASRVSYNGSDVETALDELNADINKGSVSVTADGVKTRKQLLESLHTLIDYSKLNEKSVLEFDGFGVYFLTTIGADNATFSRVRVGTTSLTIDEYTVASSASAYKGAVSTNGNYTRNDESATVIATGKIFKLIY